MMSPSPFPPLPSSLPYHIFSSHICPLVAMLSAPPPWLLKLSDWELTPPTEVPLSMWLKQSMVNNVRRDLIEEATARGMTLIAMRRYLIDLLFQTLTYREKCLQDRWLGMEQTLPLLMTTGRSPSPTTVFDLSSSLPWRMSSPLTPLPSTVRTVPLPIHRHHRGMSPHVPTRPVRLLGTPSSTIKLRSPLSRGCKHCTLPPQAARPCTTTTSGPSRPRWTAPSTKSRQASGTIPARTMSPSLSLTKTVNFTKLTMSKSSSVVTPSYLLFVRVTLTFMGQPCMPLHTMMEKSTAPL